MSGITNTALRSLIAVQALVGTVAVVSSSRRERALWGERHETLCGLDTGIWDRVHCEEQEAVLLEVGNGLARNGPTSTSTSTSKTGVVIAHYHEDASWIDDYFPEDKYEVYVYSKGGMEPNFNRSAHKFTLTNEGRDGHTHLTHIVRNYDKLEDQMLFIPADAAAEGETYALKRGEFFDVMKELGRGLPAGFAPSYQMKDCAKVQEFDDFSIDYYCNAGIREKVHKGLISHEVCKLDRSKFKSQGDFRKFYLGSEKYDKCPRYVSYFGSYAAKRENVRSRPLSVYKGLLESMSGQNAPENGFFLEHLWSEIFSGL